MISDMDYLEIIEAAKTLHANQLEPLIDELREMLKWKKSLLSENTPPKEVFVRAAAFG